ncbi:cation transporter [candidate division KSB1 bacterium]|nr:cation transporter [candidate division KSB1 bacterium]
MIGGNNLVDTSKQVKKVTWVGMIINIFLSALKFIVGFMGNSHAVIADAVHSLSDMSTDIIVLFGVKYWTAPADEDHPYGHRRIEAIITVTIGVILALVAFSLCYQSFHSFSGPLAAPHWTALFGPLLSLFLKESLFRWTRRVGERLRSSAVIANAWHHRSDALSSIPAFLAVIIAAFRPQWAFVDLIGAILVSLIIIKAAWDIIAPAIAELSDRGGSPQDLDMIERIARSVDEVQSVHAIRTRKIGYGLSVDLHIQVAGEMTVKKGHDISANVKYTLLRDGPNVLDVVVHLEPIR